MENQLLTLKETVDKYGLLAKKSLGQNFLLNMNITEKIIRTSLSAQKKTNFANEEVYEIGPGPGGLTRAILKANPEKLTVIEMDSRCIQIMEELQETYKQLEIVEGNALKFDFTQPSEHKKNIVSNLPYNISVPLLIGWLKEMKHYDSLTLMFQKEVGERITATPKTKEYGRISVLSQLICNVETLFHLNPNCFVPAPKIWSSVLLFTPKTEQLDTDLIDEVEKITEKAFGQRRKMIRQSLKGLTNLEARCATAGIELTSRAEDITPEQYYLLAKSL